MSDRDDLVCLLRNAGVSPSGVVERLAEYGALLLHANRRVNLTGARTAADLAPHLVDSLSISPFVDGALVDIGSGGGVPAVPVSIATGHAVTLIESIAKKAAFLEAVVAELGLPARVVPARAEDVARDADLRECFRCASARAVSTAPTVLELTLPFVQVGGVALLQRGRMDEQEREAVQDAAPMLGGAQEEEVRLGGDVRIVVVRKVAPTPNRFPRRAGIPEKRPLCM